MDKKELKGTIVPLVTPFHPDESLNIRAMEQLIDFVMDQGADGLMPTALTGEGPQLTRDEKIAVWDVVFQKTGNKLPVIPAIVSTTTSDAIHLVNKAEEKKANAVMVAPILTEIYVGPTHDDIICFYEDIANSTSLPIILFNYPSLTGVDFVPALVARLAEIENVKYIKESTGDIKRVHGIERLVGKRLSVISGCPNVALESFALGVKAWITGIMNNVPRSAQQLMQSVHELGDLNLARRIYYEQILPLVDVIINNNNSIGTIKAGVCIRGVNVGTPRCPGRPVKEDDYKRLEKLFADIERAETQTAVEIEKRKRGTTR